LRWDFLGSHFSLWEAGYQGVNWTVPKTKGVARDNLSVEKRWLRRLVDKTVKKPKLANTRARSPHISVHEFPSVYQQQNEEVNHVQIEYFPPDEQES